MTDTIHLFGGRGDPLSNFARVQLACGCPFCHAAAIAQTVEHGWQADKATDCGAWHHIIDAPTAMEARARGRRCALRGDWEATHPAGGLTVKATLMLGWLQRKFELTSFAAHLEATGTAILIEDAPWDGYWGAGPDGHGTNALGRLLMKVRADRRTGRTDTPIPGPTPPVQR